MKSDSMRRRNKHQSGFTLIELLVVISIIGLLASVVLTAVGAARVKARDVKRLADMSQFQKALELYYNDNGAYPLSGPSADGSTWTASTDASWSNLQTRMSATLGRLPTDPMQTAGTTAGQIYGDAYYGYAYFSGTIAGCDGGQFYILVFKQEQGTISNPSILWCNTAWGAINYNNGGTSARNKFYVIGVH